MSEEESVVEDEQEEREETTSDDEIEIPMPFLSGSVAGMSAVAADLCCPAHRSGESFRRRYARDCRCARCGIVVHNFARQHCADGSQHASGVVVATNTTTCSGAHANLGSVTQTGLTNLNHE